MCIETFNTLIHVKLKWELEIQILKLKCKLMSYRCNSQQGASNTL